MSRPSKYTAAIAEEIAERLSNGEPLRAICRDDHIPAWRTIYDWIDKDPKLSARIAHARDLGYDAIAEEALLIADTQSLGEITTIKADGGIEVKKEDMLGHRKHQIETRLKLLAKWNPKKYGDKVTHSGDASAPIALILNGSDVHG